MPLPELRPLKKGDGFSPERLRESEGDYVAQQWITYDTLRSLCRRHPEHTSRNCVAAKVWIIGRTYSTQIERKVKSDGGQGSALHQVVTFMHENCGTIDESIGGLPNYDEMPLDDSLLPNIISAHGALVELLKVVTGGHAARSFASKYLHFHRPVVPIYDSVTSGVLSKLVRWRRIFDSGRLGNPEDADYRQFVMHLRQLNGLAPTKPSVRALDWYLMREAERFRAA